MRINYLKFNVPEYAFHCHVHDKSVCKRRSWSFLKRLRERNRFHLNKFNFGNCKQFNFKYIFFSYICFIQKKNKKCELSYLNIIN